MDSNVRVGKALVEDGSSPGGGFTKNGLGTLTFNNVRCTLSRAT